jgi:hypothetical protein
MGNNAVTGHVVAATSGAVSFQKTLQLMMYQHSIQPWSARQLIQPRLDRQRGLCERSAFRFIPVEEGLAFYAQHCGGWIVQLTREKFVGLSMQLFQSKGLRCPAEEAKQFYDVFDSIDLYQNATLSIGELAGGLSSFLAGTFEQRGNAIFNALDPERRDTVSKSVLSEFIKPYVWSMVPPNAEVLRPILLPFVVDEITSEMTFSPQQSSIARQQMLQWMRRGQPAFVQQRSQYENILVR